MSGWPVNILERFINRRCEGGSATAAISCYPRLRVGEIAASLPPSPGFGGARADSLLLRNETLRRPLSSLGFQPKSSLGQDGQATEDGSPLSRGRRPRIRNNLWTQQDHFLVEKPRSSSLCTSTAGVLSVVSGCGASVPISRSREGCGGHMTSHRGGVFS
jgi:hypothetical protein